MKGNEVIDRPPRTIMEVFKMLPEGTLAELIDGILYMSPSPIRPHQRIVSLLAARITVFVEENDLGETYVAPFDVYLDEGQNAVQPDIVFVSKNRLSIIDPVGHIHGTPDLTIEVLSSGNREYDQEKKKELYERFGVREYWIIDPSTKEATGYSLQNGKYVVFFTACGKIQSRLLNQSFSF
jgi:Uma2 family endonuclease